MTRGRYVVCGPCGAGKTTWVNRHARRGDYRFDFDSLAACLTMGTLVLPAPVKGNLPTVSIDLLLRVREAFLDWVMAVGPLGDARVFVIVHDYETARVIAQELSARLVCVDPDHQVHLGARP